MKSLSLRLFVPSLSVWIVNYGEGELGPSVPPLWLGHPAGTTWHVLKVVCPLPETGLHISIDERLGCGGCTEHRHGHMSVSAHSERKTLTDQMKASTSTSAGRERGMSCSPS